MDYNLIIDIVLASSSLLLVVLYHILFIAVYRWKPLMTTQGVNNVVRGLWVKHVMKDSDKYALMAIQAQRNVIMACSFLAGAAITIGLAFVGYTLSTSTQIEKFVMLGSTDRAVTYTKILALFISLSFSFFNFTICIRYLNHATQIMTLPKGARNIWGRQGMDLDVTSVANMLNLGYLHYTLGMRGYYIAIPICSWIFGPVPLFVLTSITLFVLAFQDAAKVRHVIQQATTTNTTINNNNDIEMGDHEIQV